MIDTIIILIYFLILTSIGVLSAKKINTFKDYALSHTKYSYLVIIATLSASFLGGGFTMGISGKVYNVGLIAVIGMFGFSVKELVVAKVFAKHFSKFPNAISIGDIMKEKYGKLSKIISGILGTIVCAGIVGVQINALGYIWAEFFNINQTHAIIIATALLTFYTVLGGLTAIIISDIIQFWILIIGLPLLCIIGLIEVGGVTPLVQSLPASHISFSMHDLWASLVLFLSIFFGETFVPPYIQRLMIGKETKDTEKGTFFSGILSIPIFIIAGILGLIALTLYPSINSEAVIPTLLHNLLPIGLKGLLATGLLSAVMSTADSFLQAGAVSFVHDSVKPLLKTNDDKRELLLFRLSTVTISLLALIAAIKVKGLIDLCMLALTFWSPIMLVPFAAVLLGIQVSKKHFYIPAISAAIVALISNSLLLGVLTSLLVFCLLKIRKANDENR